MLEFRLFSICFSCCLM